MDTSTPHQALGKVANCARLIIVFALTLRQVIQMMKSNLHKPLSLTGLARSQRKNACGASRRT